MLSPFPKTASCVYSLGTGKIPCTTQKSYLHRKPQSPFSAQTIKARFKKALYTWQAQSDHRWSRTPRAILGRAPFHSHIQTPKLPPASSAAARRARSGLWCIRILGKFICLYPTPRSCSTARSQGIWVKPSHAPNWRGTEKVGVSSPKKGVLPKKGKKEIWSEEFTDPEKTSKKKKLSCALYSHQKNAQRLPRNLHFITDSP